MTTTSEAQRGEPAHNHEHLWLSDLRKTPNGEVRLFSADRKLISGTYALHVTRSIDAMVREATSKRRTITLVEELQALPDGSVVLDPDGDVARKVLGGWTTTVVEGDGAMWLTDNQEDVDLPATVLWEPEA